MVTNNHNQCSEIRQGNFWGLIFCRGSFYGFVGSPHAKRNVVNHLIFQSEFPVFPYKGSGTPDLWTLSFSSVMSCVLYARSRYICLDLVNGVWIKIIYILYIYIYINTCILGRTYSVDKFCKFPSFLLGSRIHFFSLVRRV